MYYIERGMQKYCYSQIPNSDYLTSYETATDKEFMLTHVFDFAAYEKYAFVFADYRTMVSPGIIAG